MSEEWKPVEGWPYEASNLGRVRRVGADRVCSLQVQAGKGYLRAWLYRGSKKSRKLKRVHVLVAGAFIGPRPPGLEVNHKDGDKTNNSSSNLEYVTHGDNLRHAFRMGLADRHRYARWAKAHREVYRGTRSVSARLNDEQVREIRRLIADGATQASVAARFSVARQTISLIALRRSWAHVADQQ